MRIRIKYRLFLGMLAATATVVICMFLIMQWTMTRGFLRYVNTIERERLERLCTELSREFDSAGSWEPLRRDRDSWNSIVSGTLPADYKRLRGKGAPAQPFESRVFLLDEARLPVCGPPAAEQPPLRPVLVGERVVGYLGLLPRDHLTDAMQLRFLKRQKMSMAYSAVLIFLVSAAVALPLANRVVTPIRRLAQATHRLASGDFGTRVPSEGDDELRQLARDFNGLALSLERNEQARRQWIADISHELRTPLSVLRGEIEGMQDGVRATDSDGLRSLHAEVMHLGRIVDDLYQLSLSDVGALSYRKEDIDLASVLAQTLDSARPRFEQREIGLRMQAEYGSFPIFGDRARLCQLFGNLLDNSLKYTDPGGVLEVRLRREGGDAVVDFIDSAPGVPDEELARLFERLYRVESSRNRSTGGAGLGLSICRNVTEAHGGTVAADRSPSGGLWVKVRLPLSEGSQ